MHVGEYRVCGDRLCEGMVLMSVHRVEEFFCVHILNAHVSHCVHIACTHITLRAHCMHIYQGRSGGSSVVFRW